MLRYRVGLAAGSIVIFLLSLLSINTDVGSDPKLTLLVSQALVDHHTSTLDPFRDDLILGRPMADYLFEGIVIKAPNGRLVHYFPLGPSLLAVPAVAAARLLGLDMRTDDNYRLQNGLSALTTAAVFVLMVSLARAVTDERESLIIGAVSTLGSSLVSTLGTALWSHNFTVLLLSGALLLLARHDRDVTRSVHPWWFGSLVFLAFICRPTSAAFIVPAFAYLALRERRTFLPAALGAGGLLIAYLGVQLVTTGSAVPAYYSPGRLSVERAPLWVGMVGNLASPSRGLFVFSPFLLPVAVALLAGGRRTLGQPLVLVCLAWFALHLFLVGRAASWWGGWSFGPRLLTDLWPGFVYLTAVAWASLRTQPSRDAAAVAYLSLGVAAIFLHLVQGLNSQPASQWNAMVNPLPHPGAPLGDFFVWRIMQPLATNQMLCERELAVIDYAQSPLLVEAAYGSDLTAGLEPRRPTLSSTAVVPVKDGRRVGGRFATYLPLAATAGPIALLSGWSTPPAGSADSNRWSRCAEAAIVLRLPARPPSGGVVLRIDGRTLGPQRYSISVNGRPPVQVIGSGVEQNLEIPIPAEALQPGRLNIVSFTFPQAHFPTRNDQRPLGLLIDAVSLHEDSPPRSERLRMEPYPAP